MSREKRAITVARGDGIGPEIMDVVLHVLDAAGAALEIHEVEIGEKVYRAGHAAGIEPETWESLRKTKVFLKAPITTPQGGGFKSLNVTIRTSLGLYANVRPCISYHPVVSTKHPEMDVVVIRENEEDLYTGIEYHQTPETYHSIKMITQPGTDRIIRFAFDYARSNGRKKVTCFTKDNILKIADGFFHERFEAIAKEYPDLENEHWIIDIGAAKLADTPEAFDLLVLPNLYGDILSDVAAQIAGSVGLAGSANIGSGGAMFEAIHGSAPRRAGQNLANPSGLLLAAVMMLVHIDQPDVATTIHNSWLRTLEDGIHTYDIFKEGVSKKKVGTKEFGEAIIANLGEMPKTFKAAHYQSQPPSAPINSKETHKRPSKKELVGVDIFIHHEGTLDALLKELKPLHGGHLRLGIISNRGVRVWPEGHPETLCVDQWRCRFLASEVGGVISHQQIAELLHEMATHKIDFTKSEQLYRFDGVPAYSGADLV